VRAQIPLRESLSATAEAMAQIFRRAPGEPPPQVRKTADESRKDHARAA
jgi:hypothetical protein